MARPQSSTTRAETSVSTTDLAQDFPAQGAGARGQRANCLTEVFRLRAETHPNRTAFRFLLNGEDETIAATYQEIDHRARAIAAQLQMSGADNERALLLYDSGLEYIAALAGCFYAGVVAVPVYPPDPMRMARMGPRLQAIAEDCGARFVLGVGEDLARSAPLLNHIPQIECRLATDQIDTSLASQWTQGPQSREDLALLQYTSGSTDTPKGVMVRHGNLLTNLSQIEERLDVVDAVGATWLPLYHDLGLIGCVLQAWYSGREMLLMAPVTFFQRPIRWLQAISKYRVTTAGAPDFGYDLCVRRIKPEEVADLDLSCWQIAASGAEPVRADTIERFVEKFASCGVRREIFRPCYGLAEATLMVAGVESHSTELTRHFDSAALAAGKAVPSEDASDAGTSRPLVRCGQPSQGQQIAIVDPESGVELSESCLGEVWVCGPNVAAGYWNRPELSEATFNAYLPDGRGPFLRTGDVGFICDGELFLTGRLKDLIIISGKNHHPEDIERTVENSHEALRPYAGAAFSVEREERERVIVIHEVSRPKQQNLESILDDIRRDVFNAHDIVIDGVVLIQAGTLPKTSSGKVQRHSCREYFENERLSVLRQWMAPCFEESDSEELRAEYVAPRNELETTLASAWAEVFGLDRVGIEDNFFSLGGHSLLATQLAARLEPQLGITLDVSELLDYPTIEQLAKRIVALQQELQDEEALLLERLESMSDAEASALLAEQTGTNAMIRETQPQQLDYLIIGAGPAGLQLGYFLQRDGRDYAILERGAGAGTFFRQYPRHRMLISINKIYTGHDDPEVNLRWDWNSLLTDDAKHSFKEYSSDFFPDADALVDYLEDFARETEQNVHYNADVVNIAKKDRLFHVRLADGREFISRVLVVASGCHKPYVPDVDGIELAENYSDVSVDPKDFLGQRVLILGKGNSAFETADRLMAVTSLTHLVSPETVKLAWQTHFVGHLRAVNNNFLDTYQLKSQNALLDATVECIRKVDDHYEVSFSYAHASGEVETMRYDRIIVCTGFSFDHSMFDESCRPELTHNNRFPDQTSRWESTNVPDLYFAGALMQARDFKKKQSAFIHGFRYNVRALSRLLAATYEGTPLEFTELPLDPAAVAGHILDRVNGDSALWQQTGFLGDLLIVDREANTVRYYNELPVDFMHDSDFGNSKQYHVLTMEFGQDRINAEPNVFAISRVHKDDASSADQSTAIHPILRGFKDGDEISEHHVIEDLMAVWKEPVHRDPLVAHLQDVLSVSGQKFHIAMDQAKGHASAPAESR